MEKRFKSTIWRCLFVAGVLLLWGCDSGGANDTFDSDSLARIRVTLQPADGSGTIAGEVEGTDSGDARKDTLRVEWEQTYDGRLRLYNGAGEEITEQFKEQAEAYQFFYTVQGIEGVNVRTTDVESNYGADEGGGNLPVGLTFELTVAADARWRQEEDRGVRLQLGHYVDEPKDGERLTVAPSLDVVVPVEKPAGPGRPESIGKVELWLEAFPVTIQADPSRLNSGERPSTLRTKVTAPRRLPAFVRLFNEAGEDITQEIRREGEWHQLFVTPEGALADVIEIEVTDEDVKGRPLGLNFDLTLSEPSEEFAEGNLHIQLGHYDPSRGDPKDGASVSQVTDLDFLLQLQVTK